MRPNLLRAALVACLLAPAGAMAQTPVGGTVVDGGLPAYPPYQLNGTAPVTIDKTTGGLRILCVSGCSSGTGTAVPASSSAAVGPMPATSITSSLIAKASAGNLYGYSITAGSTAGYLALLNAAAVPSGGTAISPIECIPVAVTSYVARRQDIPDRYGTGIVAVFTSSCTTYTAVTPQLITAVVQ